MNSKDDLEIVYEFNAMLAKCSNGEFKTKNFDDMNYLYGSKILFNFSTSSEFAERGMLFICIFVVTKLY